MALPWVRLDTNIGSHDKILSLLSDPSAKRWQAYASYVTALAWSGGHGTDGRIPVSALPFVHGTTATARLLVKHKLWDEQTAAWQIVNFGTRQMTADVVTKVTGDKRRAGVKGNCIRHHGAGCWDEQTGCNK